MSRKKVNKIITPDNSSKYNILEQERKTKEKENEWYLINCFHVFDNNKICIYCGLDFDFIYLSKYK